MGERFYTAGDLLEPVDLSELVAASAPAVVSIRFVQRSWRWLWRERVFDTFCEGCPGSWYLLVSREDGRPVLVQRGTVRVSQAALVKQLDAHYERLRQTALREQDQHLYGV